MSKLGGTKDCAEWDDITLGTYHLWALQGSLGVLCKFIDNKKKQTEELLTPSRAVRPCRDTSQITGLGNPQTYEVQQGDVPDPEPGMGQPWLYGQTGERDAEKQYCGKGPDGQNSDS